ncbi:hypothetical protein PIB30_067621 [Stylosanthes scabra]|uniref:Uncharacterized protein n=1 Tax=Stylosanthes scabra TaxID=79078 RepID=A0ABU6TPV8_9FABA|nr:hypothetical protein [Stylosanthes scabra]
MASSGNQNSTLKRRLDFDLEEVAPNESLQNIWQRGYGSPFTVYAFKGMDMVSEDTPECLDLVFWPPRGMTFAGFELIVAAYIFSNGLDMSEILVPNFLARDTREMLWSLRPGKELFDDILNLVVKMQTARKEDTKWWLPTTFVEIAVDPHFNTQATMEFIEKKYMSDADNLIRAEYLNRFLTADRFYKDKSSFRLKPSEFDFIEPQVGQQRPLS